MVWLALILLNKPVCLCVLMGEFGPTVVEAITKASFTGLSVYGTIF